MRALSERSCSARSFAAFCACCRADMREGSRTSDSGRIGLSFLIEE